MRWYTVLVLSLIVFLSFAGYVRAAQCEESFFTIFRVSSDSNAHVANWNFLSYDTTLCLEDIGFDVVGINSETDLLTRLGGISSGELRKAKPNGENTILRGYYENNTHASVPSHKPYQINFSYGDFVCRIQEGGICSQITEHPGGHPFVFIAALNSHNNSHVTINGSSYDRVEDLIVCCRSNDLASSFDTCNNNGKIDNANEECDWNSTTQDFGGQTCSSVTDGSYSIGNLNCVKVGDACEIRENDCDSEEELSLFCEEYGIDDSNPNNPVHKLLIDGEYIEPTSCNDYNNITLDDLDYYELDRNDANLTYIKQNMCNDCSRYISESTLAEYLPQDGFSPYCFWNEGVSPAICQLRYSRADGSQCTVRVVTEGVCSGNAYKDILVTDTCEYERTGECGPENPCPKQVPCPRVVQLPFFDWLNFVAAIGVIGLAYFVYHRIRK